MTVRIRLARSGTKKRPFYRIVATSSRNSRDGGFLEKLGTYDPILPSDSPKRIVLREERVRYWLGVGAQPSDRVARFLDNAGITESAARWRGTGKRAEEIAARKAGEAAAEAAPAGSSAPAEAKAPAPETQAKAAAEDPKVEAADAEAAPETEEAAAPATVESNEAAEPKVAAQDVGAAPESAGAAEGEVAPDTPGADEPAKPAADAS